MNKNRKHSKSKRPSVCWPHKIFGDQARICKGTNLRVIPVLIDSSATQETGMANANISVRLFEFESRGNYSNFLVDMGSEISLLPSGNMTNKNNFKLYANNTRINTYGELFRTLHLGIYI